MPQLKAVGVRELKNQLSSYLRDVKAGHRILVTERGTVVAELRPSSPADLAHRQVGPLDEWVAAGRLIPPRADPSSLPASPLKLPEGTSAQLLDEERAD